MLTQTQEVSGKTSDIKEKPNLRAAPRLTDDQQRGLDAALDFADSSPPRGRFVFSGLAGTGKTTTMIECIRQLKASGARPAICTPTGKAAHVINSKQSEFQAMTLHKVLTESPLSSLRKIHEELDALELKRAQGTQTAEEEARELFLLDELARVKKEGENLSFRPRLPEDVEASFDILLFDEASMIGQREHYAKYIYPIGLPYMFFGDGAQLPPVKDDPAVDFSRADVRLDKILRQGAESGILHVAHSVHKGKVPHSSTLKQFSDVTIIPTHESRDILAFAQDHQYIVWTNKERWKLNGYVRSLRGYAGHSGRDYWPNIGEKLLVNENDETLRLLKGQLITVESCTECVRYPDNRYLCDITFTDDMNRLRSLTISLTDMCATQTLHRESEYIEKSARKNADQKGVSMRWPYAVTAHTAQGSEWDKCVVVGSMMPESVPDWKKWWYTAITRAKDELVLASYHFAHE